VDGRLGDIDAMNERRHPSENARCSGRTMRMIDGSIGIAASRHHGHGVPVSVRDPPGRTHRAGSVAVRCSLRKLEGASISDVACESTESTPEETSWARLLLGPYVRLHQRQLYGRGLR
jgi:hypothetical protein